MAIEGLVVDQLDYDQQERTHIFSSPRVAMDIGLYETVRSGTITLEELRLADVVFDF